MRCQKAQEQFSDYLEQKLDAKRCEPLDLHLQACTACRRELAEVRAVWRALDQMPQVEPPPDAMMSVMLRVQRERANQLSRQQARTPAWARWIAQINPLRTAGMAAAAAALVLGAFVASQPDIIPLELNPFRRSVSPSDLKAPQVTPTPRIQVGFGDVVQGQIPVRLTITSPAVLANAKVTARRSQGVWLPSGEGGITPEKPGQLDFNLPYAPGQVESIQLNLKAEGVGRWNYLIITPLGPSQAPTVSLALENITLRQALTAVVAQIGRPVVVDGDLNERVTIQVSSEEPESALRSLAAQSGRRLVTSPGLQLVQLR